MSTSFDNALREALARTADAPAPPGLAPAAIGLARRRRARRAVTGLAAVAVVALAAPVALSMTSTADESVDQLPALSQPAGGPGPLVVTAYSGLMKLDSADGGAGTQPDGVDDGARSLLLDRSTGEYVELPYESVVPAPDGTRALVYTGDNSPDDPLRVGVIDAPDWQVQWIEDLSGNGSLSTGAWSPDGREILLTENTRLGRNGFAIIDAETLEVTFVEHADLVDPTVNSMGLRYVWSPDGTEIALTESTSANTSEAEPDQVTGIRFYDRDGTLTRTIPATAALTREASFSPDGAWIALHDPYRSDARVQIVDATTGELRQEVPLPGWVTAVGWADDQHLFIVGYEEGPTGVTQRIHIVDFDGIVVTTVEVLDGTHEAAEIQLGSSDGLPAEAADLTFGSE